MAPREDDHENYDEAYVEDAYDAPSDDDTYVEDASDDGEWVDGEEEATQEPAPQKKKSSAMTTVIIVVVAVVGVLGFMVMKGSKAPSDAQMAPAEVAQPLDQAPATPPMPADQTAQPAPAEQPVDAATAQTATTAPAPQQGLMDNPDLANQGSLQPLDPAAAPQPTDAKPENAGLAGAVTAAAPNVQAVSDFPTVDSIKKPDNAAAAPAPSLEDVATQATPSLTAPAETMAPANSESAPQLAPPVAVQDQATKSQLEAANSKIEELTKALSAKDSELQKQKEALKSAPNDAELSALKAKIAELEGKLSTGSTSSTTSDIDTARDVKPVSAKPAKAPAAAKAKVSSGTETATSKPSWVLKSAKPGHAVISNAKTGDYRSISVGDDVAGIGKVTAIGESPSGWAVQGTKGKISE